MWGIFYKILSVPQNTVTDLNNVMLVPMHSSYIRIRKEHKFYVPMLHFLIYIITNCTLKVLQKLDMPKCMSTRLYMSSIDMIRA